MTRLLCMLVMATLGAASGVRAPHQPPPVAPAPAYSVGAAMDAKRNRLVIFGGYTGRYVADTWQWDGGAWTRFDGSGPPARNSPAMVYDAARSQIVMFGGDTRATGALADTWTFDGASWVQVATDGPPPRTTHHMVYDSARQRVVMFGGVNGTTLLDDTWEWDGRRWTRSAATGPQGRALAGMAYDSARRKVVLFGGMPVMAPNIPSLGDTWEYDGTRWSQVQVPGPSARDHVAMDYDAARRLVVLHGGGLQEAEQRETWTFDGRQWTREQTAGPARRYARLAFDPAAGSMLLFGGFDRNPSNELWRLAGNGWTRVR